MGESARQQGSATDRASEVRFGNVPGACVVESVEEVTLRVEMTVERNNAPQTQRKSKQSDGDYLLDKTMELQSVKPCISAVHGVICT